MSGSRPLLVDDSKMSREALCAHLQGQGYQVVGAPGGQEALDLVRSQEFDLVLLGIEMPEMNGLEVLLNLRQAHRPAPTVKVLDMGLARLAQPSGPEGDAGGLTQEGRWVGTPDYMAPEQAMRAQSVDIRADLYSLGCTLYHLLTGRVPFPDPTPMEKVLKHNLSEPTPVDRLRPEVPAKVAAVVRRLMAKGPAERFPTPTDAAEALK
jgi:CheY-like chemotaxis protein